MRQTPVDGSCRTGARPRSSSYRGNGFRRVSAERNSSILIHAKIGGNVHADAVTAVAFSTPGAGAYIRRCVSDSRAVLQVPQLRARDAGVPRYVVRARRGRSVDYFT